MTGIEEVLERLVTDASFKEQLARDPQAALRSYTLSTDDVRLLAAQVSGDAGGLGAVEQRTSKSGLFGMLANMFGGGGGGPAPTLEGGDLEDSLSPGDGLGDGSEVSEAVMLEQPSDDVGMIIDGGRGGPGGDGAEVMDAVMLEQPSDDVGIVIDNSQPGPGPGGDGAEVFDPILSEQPADQVGFAGGGGGDGAEVSDVILTEQPADEQGMVIEGGHAGPGDDVAFNPQPDPPGTDPFHIETIGGGGSTDADALMIKEVEPGLPADGMEGGRGAPGDDVAFNPQPDPPGTDPFHIETIGGGGSDADALMFKEVDPSPALDGIEGVAIDGGTEV